MIKIKEYEVLVTITYSDLITANTPEEAERIAYDEAIQAGYDNVDAEWTGEEEGEA